MRRKRHKEASRTQWPAFREVNNLYPHQRCHSATRSERGSSFSWKKIPLCVSDPPPLSFEIRLVRGQLVPNRQRRGLAERKSAETWRLCLCVMWKMPELWSILRLIYVWGYLFWNCFLKIFARLDVMYFCSVQFCFYYIILYYHQCWEMWWGHWMNMSIFCWFKVRWILIWIELNFLLRRIFF